MANVIEQIHKDHVNLGRLLNLVDAEIDKARQDGMPDFLMLEHVMRYMTNYLDQIHHNKEDAMFRRVVSLDPQAKGAVDDLTLEHEKLKTTGCELYDLVCAAQNSDFVRREDVISQGTDYVRRLRAHMDKEEGDLLERARRLLTEQDLREVDVEVESIHDPLFGDTVEKEYQSLYAYIMAQQESVAEAGRD
jgi:hemerythrin-like domain-containing protein